MMKYPPGFTVKVLIVFSPREDFKNVSSHRKEHAAPQR
jgi:hypothetical protein